MNVRLKGLKQGLSGVKGIEGLKTSYSRMFEKKGSREARSEAVVFFGSSMTIADIKQDGWVPVLIA